MKINPDDANAQANLGSALAAFGQLNEAKSHYGAAFGIDPSNQLARDNLQELERLTKQAQH